jgi:hypothetical protein
MAFWNVNKTEDVSEPLQVGTAAEELEFLCPPELKGKIPEPAPAARFMPKWFKEMNREMDMKDEHGLPGLTVKACLPVTDVMAQGYIIPLPFAVWTAQDPVSGGISFQWDKSAPFDPIAPHHPDQIGAHKPPFEGVQPLKFINPWRIRVPIGWSASLVHPYNHFQLPFSAFNGTVDCDALDVPVNVPFVWTAQKPVVHLPAGTPMIQVVPFERAHQLRHAIVRSETDEEVVARRHANKRKHTEESLYTRQWRRRHERETKS